MSDLEERVENLARVLEAEERIYLELRDLLQRERESMIALDAAGLAGLVEAKEMSAAEARFLEESRIEISRQLAAALGVELEPPSLSALCAVLGDRAGRLPQLHSRLAALLSAVRELVDANASFAGDSLAQVRGTLRLFASLAPAGATYGRGTGSDPVAQPGGLVRRSA